MSKSCTTLRIERRLKEMFPWLEIESPLKINGNVHRCDLAGVYDKHSCGIEIKVSSGDFDTGYGLNQEHYDYGFVCVPSWLLATAIGKLWLKGMRNTGVITYNSATDELRLAKVAQIASHRCNVPVEVWLSEYWGINKELTEGSCKDGSTKRRVDNNAP